jgi:hypothetical protein
MNLPATQGIIQFETEPRDTVKDIRRKINEQIRYFDWAGASSCTVHITFKKLSELQMQNINDALSGTVGTYLAIPKKKRDLIAGYAIIDIVAEA